MNNKNILIQELHGLSDLFWQTSNQPLLKTEKKMAIGTIIIEKIENHKNNNQSIAFYEISSGDFDIKNFYMRIDKLNKTISFFLERDFSKDPIRLINYNKNDRLGIVPGIPTMVLSIVVRHALRVFNMDIFPESLSYSA